MEHQHKATIIIKPCKIGNSMGFVIKQREFILDKDVYYRITVEVAEKC